MPSQPSRPVAQCGPPEPAQRRALPRRTPCSGIPCRRSSPSPSCAGSATTRGGSAAAWTAISSPRSSPRSSVSWWWRRSGSRCSKRTSARSRGSARRSTGRSPPSSARATRQYVTSPGGYIIGWLLAFFGVAIVAAITGALVGFVIDFLLKEGQGMGAAGFRDHIVVCGWNAPRATSSRSSSGDESTRRSSCSTTASATPPATASTSCAATSRTPTTSSGPASRRRMAAVVFPADALERGGHALDPDGDGDRVDRAAGAHRGRGQQPDARRPLQAGATPTRSWSRRSSRRACLPAPRSTPGSPAS